MKLITKEILEKLPLLKDLEDPATMQTKVPLKLFNPTGSATWFILAIDGQTKAINQHTILYGVCCIYEPAFGSVSLQELKAIQLPFGLGIERDIHWSVDRDLKAVNDYLEMYGYGTIDYIATR